MQLLPQQILELLAILSELLDTLVELVESHSILEKLPAELGLVVDEGDFGEWVGLGCERGVEFLGYGLCGVLELFEEGWGDSVCVGVLASEED